MTESELRELLKGKNTNELLDLLIIGLESSNIENDLIFNEMIENKENIA